MFELAQSDYDILHSIENIVDGIAAMYGEHTEVLLHSLDVRNPSIIKIANSHVTGRDVGAPITNLALMKLTQGKDVSGAYMTKCPDGKTLRSMTTIIRNPQTESHRFVMYQHQPRCTVPRSDAFTGSLFASASRKTSNDA